MFLSVLLVILSAYMTFNSLMQTFAVPFSEWTWMSWCTLALSAVMACIFVLSLRRAIRAYKKQAQQLKEEQAKEMEKLRAKRRAAYLEEDIDIEAEAARAEAARKAAEAARAAGGQDDEADGAETSEADSAETSEADGAEKADSGEAGESGAPAPGSDAPAADEPEAPREKAQKEE